MTNWDLITSSADQKTKKVRTIKTMKPSKRLQKFAAYAAIVLMFGAILLNATDNLNYPLILNQSQKLISALLTTLSISLVTLALSLVGGFLFYLAMKSENTFKYILFSTA